jgi:hypothetical protein
VTARSLEIPHNKHLSFCDFVFQKTPANAAICSSTTSFAIASPEAKSTRQPRH